MHRRPVLVLLATVLLAAAPAGGASEPVLRPHLFETAAGERVEAEWGTLEVPEDRGNPGSGTLQLAFVRLPSTAAVPGPPIVYLAGGPGSSGIESAKGPRYALLDALRAAGDVVLLDQRGTGSSRPGLICNDAWSLPRDRALGADAMLAVVEEQVRACAARLRAAGHDLDAYNPVEIAADVDALRRALGAESVSLVATSFGTHLALTVLRHHPEAVERAVLLGVVGPDHGLKLAAGVQRALERVGEAVELPSGEPFPQAMAAVLARLEQPVPVRVEDPLSGEMVDLSVGRFEVALATVGALGDGRGLASLAADYARMRAGDFSGLGFELLAARKSWIGRAMTYATLCTAGASEERLRAIRAQRAAHGLGGALDFPFPEICDALGVAPLGPEHRQPVRSEVPVLLVSGSLDVRTPLENAVEVLAGLPNGQHLVVEGAGHGDDLLVSTPEIARAAAAFLGGEPVDAEVVAAEPLWRRVPPPPRAEPRPVVETIHGVEVSDPFRWLENGDTPDTRWWIEVQNRYTDSLLEVLPERAALHREVASLLSPDGAGLPFTRGERTFYARRRAGEEVASLVVREADGSERVLVDPRAVSAEPGATVALLDVSADGGVLAWSLRETGGDEVEVRFLEVATGRILPDRLPRGRYYGVALVPDGSEAWYGRERGVGESGRLYHHRLGTDAAGDREVFGAGLDASTVVWGNLSDDGRYLVIHAVSGTQHRVDLHLLDLEAEERRPVRVVEGIDATFFGAVVDGRLVVYTTWQAPRGRVMGTGLDRLAPEDWREIVPQHERRVVRAVYSAGGRLYVETVDDIRSRVETFALDGRSLGEVPFPTAGSLLGIRGRWERDDVYLLFSSYHLPPVVYRHDAASGELAVWHRAEVAVGAEDAVLTQVWFESADGTRVPMSLVHPPGLDLDGSHPTILTAYGGFATSLTPAFSPEVLAWVRRGGVYAVAHVRGGGELGQAWHQAAVREHKQRSIDDVIAAAEWLAARGYTRPARLALWGHSNGGLLVAAAMTQRPELAAAVVSSHPLLDMVRYNKFLAARFWLPEFGSPERADAFPALYAYSPYHRYDPQRPHPAVLLLTAAGDVTVAPLHARKMAALMQQHATPDRPVLLRHLGRAGHTGAGITRSQRIEELVEILSFLSWQLGETP